MNSREITQEVADSIRTKPFFSIGMMFFFWALADAIISYFTPILITDQGISETTMGIIYGTSSIFGAIIDFVLAKNVKISSYRRLFFIVFIIFIFYPLLVWRANSITFFLLIMFVWGLFYDLKTFGLHEFIAKEVQEKQHASGHAFLGIFISIGLIIGPILAGLLISANLQWQAQYIAMLFFSIGGIFLFINWLICRRKRTNIVEVEEDVFEKRSLIEELKAWRYVYGKIKYILIFVILFFLIDAVFWTISPLLSEEFANFPSFGGLFLAATLIPPLYMSWLVTRVTGKYGKKRIAFVSFAIFCLSLMSIGFVDNPYIILLIVLLGSSVGAFSLPAIEGAIADYLVESKRHDNQILGIYDFATNIGYVIGPIFAGIVADRLGNMMTFTVVAGFCAVVSIILLIVTPRSIRVETKTGREIR